MLHEGEKDIPDYGNSIDVENAVAISHKAEVYELRRWPQAPIKLE